METVHVCRYSPLLDLIGIARNGVLGLPHRQREGQVRLHHMASTSPNGRQSPRTLRGFGPLHLLPAVVRGRRDLDELPRFNKMKGMANRDLVVRDETLHCNSILNLFPHLHPGNPGVGTRTFSARSTSLPPSASMSRLHPLAFARRHRGQTATDVKSATNSSSSHRNAA